MTSDTVTALCPEINGIIGMRRKTATKKHLYESGELSYRCVRDINSNSAMELPDFYNLSNEKKIEGILYSPGKAS